MERAEVRNNRKFLRNCTRTNSYNNNFEIMNVKLFSKSFKLYETTKLLARLRMICIAFRIVYYRMSGCI